MIRFAKKSTLVFLVAFLFFAPLSSTLTLGPDIAHAQSTSVGDEIQGNSSSVAETDQAIAATASGQSTYTDCDGAVCAAFKWLVGNIGQLIITLLSWLQGASGVLLNYSINVGVIQFGKTVNQIHVIDSAWATFRDLANIVFIFGLLLIAVGTILELEEFGYKKLLIKIILLALLVNFSLFFTKFIIDVSNITATQFANAIQVCPPSENNKNVADCSGTAIGAASYGAGNAFAKALSLQAFFDVIQKDKKVGPFDVLGILLLASLFIITSVIVFVAAAVILIARAVELVFLMALAPLAFAAWALPWTEEFAMKWWKRIFANAVYAPMFMLLLWFTASIIQGGLQAALLGGVEPGEHWKNLVGGDPNAAISSSGVIFYFLFVMGALVACIWIAKELSISGVSIGMKLGSLAGLAVPAFAARNVIGRGAGALARSETLKNWSAGKRRDENGNLVDRKGFGGWALKNIGTGALLTSQKTAKGSFDLRGIPGAGTVTGALEHEGFALGSAGGKGGYEAFVKRRAEAQKAFIESLKPSEEARDKIREEAHRKNAPERAAAEATAAHSKTALPAARSEAETKEETRKTQAAKVEDLENRLARQQANGDEFGAKETEKRIAGEKQQLTQFTRDAQGAAAAVKNLEKAEQDAAKKLKDLTEAEKKAVSSLSDARMGAAAIRAKKEFLGVDISDIPVINLVRSRGSINAGIKYEEDHLKTENQKAIDTLVSAMHSSGGGGDKGGGGGGGGH